MLLLPLKKFFNHRLAISLSLFLGTGTYSSMHLLLETCGDLPVKGEIITAEKRSAREQSALWQHCSHMSGLSVGL